MKFGLPKNPGPGGIVPPSPIKIFPSKKENNKKSVIGHN